MEKQKVTMSNWSIYQDKNKEYNLSGTADIHPKLGRDVYVSYTSKLEHYELNEDVLTYETKNTIYMCPLKYMNTKNPIYANNRDYLKEIIDRNQSEDILEKIVKSEAEISLHKLVDFKYNKETNEYDKLREPVFSDFTNYIINLSIEGKEELKKNRELEENRMISFLKDNNYENSLYIEISNISAGDKLAYRMNIDGEIKEGVVYPYIHSGMFQDSILYTEYGILDFRYFPNWNGMSTYHWSDNIEKVYVKNVMDVKFTFNGEEVDIGETKEFDNKNNKEGLLSPDCVNGHNLLS